MKRFIHAISSFFFLPMLCCLAADGQRNGESEQVWVEVDVAIISATASPDEYYGSLDKKVFDSMTHAARPEGFFRLYNASFFYDGKLLRMEDITSSGGVNMGYGGMAYFRAESIKTIVLLDDSFVRKHFAKATMPGEPSRETQAEAGDSSASGKVGTAKRGTEGKIWVSVLVGAGDPTEHQGEFYGWLDGRTVAGLTETTAPMGLLELHDLHFFHQGEFMRARDVITDSDKGVQYTGTIYYHANRISRIVVLDEAFAKAHRLDEVSY